jgi:hypothetical protein
MNFLRYLNKKIRTTILCNELKDKLSFCFLTINENNAMIFNYDENVLDLSIDFLKNLPTEHKRDGLSLESEIRKTLNCKASQFNYILTTRLNVCRLNDKTQLECDTDIYNDAVSFLEKYKDYSVLDNIRQLSTTIDLIKRLQQEMSQA